MELRRQDVSVDIVLSRIQGGDESWTLVTVCDHDDDTSIGLASTDGTDSADESELIFVPSLATSERRFRLAFEGSMAPMLVCDKDGQFLAVNNAFCEMCGRSQEELLGRNSKHFTHPDDVDLSDEVRRLIMSGVIDEYRYCKRFVHDNGRVFSTSK